MDVEGSRMKPRSSLSWHDGMEPLGSEELPKMSRQRHASSSSTPITDEKHNFIVQGAMYLCTRVHNAP